MLFHTLAQFYLPHPILPSLQGPASLNSHRPTICGKSSGRRSAGSEEFRKLDPGRLTHRPDAAKANDFTSSIKRKANCLLAGSCMSGNVHVRLREKRQWKEMALLYLTLEPAPQPLCATPPAEELVVGGPAGSTRKRVALCVSTAMNRGEPSDDLSKMEVLSSGDPFTLHGLIHVLDHSYGKVDSWVWNLKLLREILSFSIPQSADATCADYRDNHSGPGRVATALQERKRLKLKPYESLKRRQECPFLSIGSKSRLCSLYNMKKDNRTHRTSARGQASSVLRRIKEEWGTSRWFLEFDIRKCFHTIDRHRLIPIFKESRRSQVLLPHSESLFRRKLVGGEKGLTPSHSVLLSALPGNIYLHARSGG
ncbi:hypothetical protein HAX54_052429 [Datura stramonium]|uniref:Reverse transcriptase domain-containing protein n=1 Tax=Datura stramonium TaxID=4076 RepID=A0ABS8RS79_DATST|nr:hypothetical protein [Datura stramonium]